MNQQPKQRRRLLVLLVLLALLLAFVLGAIAGGLITQLQGAIPSAGKPLESPPFSQYNAHRSQRSAQRSGGSSILGVAKSILSEVA